MFNRVRLSYNLILLACSNLCSIEMLFDFQVFYRTINSRLASKPDRVVPLSDAVDKLESWRAGLATTRSTPQNSGTTAATAGPDEGDRDPATPPATAGPGEGVPKGARRRVHFEDEITIADKVCLLYVCLYGTRFYLFFFLYTLIYVLTYS